MDIQPRQSEPPVREPTVEKHQERSTQSNAVPPTAFDAKQNLPEGQCCGNSEKCVDKRILFTLLDSPEGDKLLKKLWANTKYFQRRLKKAGFSTGETQTPITPIHVGDSTKAFEFSTRLYDAGVYAPPVRFPTVPEGKARLRAMVSATHKRAELDRACEIITEVGRSLGIV
jgi:hypothetical protein